MKIKQSDILNGSKYVFKNGSFYYANCFIVEYKGKRHEFKSYRVARQFITAITN